VTVFLRGGHLSVHNAFDFLGTFIFDITTHLLNLPALLTASRTSPTHDAPIHLQHPRRRACPESPPGASWSRVKALYVHGLRVHAWTGLEGLIGRGGRCRAV
jgi:hypothetical protein